MTGLRRSQTCPRAGWRTDRVRSGAGGSQRSRGGHRDRSPRPSPHVFRVFALGAHEALLDEGQERGVIAYGVGGKAKTGNLSMGISRRFP